MARSLSNVKLISTFVVDGISNAISRRAYAATSMSNGVREAASARNAAVLKKTKEDLAVATTDNVSWVPDPVTGFYKPENRVNEVCPAELRAMLLKKN